jgi:hypothetical protein
MVDGLILLIFFCHGCSTRTRNSPIPPPVQNSGAVCANSTFLQPFISMVARRLVNSANTTPVHFRERPSHKKTGAWHGGLIKAHLLVVKLAE